MNIRDFAKVMIENGFKETFNSNACKIYAKNDSNVTIFKDVSGWYFKRINNLDKLKNYIYVRQISRDSLIKCLN